MKLLAVAIALSLALVTVFPVAAAEADAPPPSTPVSQPTWNYLDANAPGPWSIVAYSLGQREIPAETRKQMLDELKQNIREGFSSPLELERSILTLLKLEEDPTDFQRNDLILQLSVDDTLYRNGIQGASYALFVYKASDQTILETARNSTAAVIDSIVSAQQREGGFAHSAGLSPDIRVTADIVAALFPYADTPYVQATIDKALLWLSAKQNDDGSYSKDGLPDCDTTAAVLTAIRSCGIGTQDERFMKNGNDLLEALDAFANADGGYAASPGEASAVEATERAVIAYYTDFTGLSPYLSPSAYPGYQPLETDPMKTYGKFIFGFLAIFGVVYLLLLLTTKIGRFAEKKKLPGSLAAHEEQQKENIAQENTQTTTLEMHIPMQAELPDFDKINEQETGLTQQTQSINRKKKK